MEMAGLVLDAQSRDKLKAWMDEALQEYTVSESTTTNGLNYTKNHVSYTFSFDENDVIITGIVRLNV
ncbi:MAG: hypothetical protein LUG13_08685 [Oscillospiraceae bacterium]|nr:hypothetical protein [Oscillospiraceae bacterium]